MDVRVTMLFAGCAATALGLLYLSGAVRSARAWLVCTVLVAAAFAVRWMGLGYESGDYREFLSRWVQYFAGNGGFAGLKDPVGNYNVPYLYFLALFSRSSVRDLYLIKLLSIFFDVLLSFFSMKLAGALGAGRRAQLTAFFAVLLLPTVVLNGSLWGQCDSIYTAFAAAGLWLAFSRRPWGSVVCIALSFAFKLQAVFILPVYAVLLFTGHIRIRHLLAFPATYLLVILPAVLAGRPFLSTLTLYFSQAGTVGGGLNYNSPSLFALTPGTLDAGIWSVRAVLWSFAFVLAVLAVSLLRRRRMDSRAVFAAAVLFAIAIPFLLPHMHDRYFFCADVLSVVMAVCRPRRAALPCLVQCGSLLCYRTYLTWPSRLPPEAGWSMAAALALALLCFAVSLKESGPSEAQTAAVPQNLTART